MISARVQQQCSEHCLITAMTVVARAGGGSLPFQKRESHCMVQEGGDPCDSLCPPQQPPNHELNEEDCPKPSPGNSLSQIVWTYIWDLAC